MRVVQDTRSPSLQSQGEQHPAQLYGDPAREKSRAELLRGGQRAAGAPPMSFATFRGASPCQQATKGTSRAMRQGRGGVAADKGFCRYETKPALETSWK